MSATLNAFQTSCRTYCMCVVACANVWENEVLVIALVYVTVWCFVAELTGCSTFFSCQHWSYRFPPMWQTILLSMPLNGALKGGKKALLIIIVCVISRVTEIYCGGSFTAHPPLFLIASLNLHSLSSSKQVWNVNDHLEGQKEKVVHFHAMLNMQIWRQISGSCNRQAHN